MAAFASYGEVIAFIQRRAGGCLSAIEDAEAFVQMALLQIRDSLGLAEEKVKTTVHTSIGQSYVILPSTVGHVLAVTLDGWVLGEGPRSYVQNATVGIPEASGKPVRWEYLQQRLWVHPIPDVVYELIVEGLTPQATVLKFNGGYVPVALPDDLSMVLAQWALGLTLADSAQERSAMWLNIANASLANWKTRVLSRRGTFVMSNGDLPYDPFPQVFIPRYDNIDIPEVS